MTSKNKNLVNINLKKTFIKLNHKISDALKSLQSSQSKICIVVDQKNYFKGLLNDGDIRRALLKGKNLETKIKEIYNKKPFILKKNFNKELSLKRLKERGIDQVPIIDKKKVIGIFFRDKFLLQHLKTPVVIMSGGLGTRLRPITSKVPKALVLIKKKPMLSIIIQNIKNFGFNNFILTTFYKHNLIKKYYKNGLNFNVKIKYITENKPLGTAGSLSLIRKKIKDKNFLLTNCDVLSGINYKNLLEYHVNNNADLTIAVKKFVTQSQYGEINLKGINIENIMEKPEKDIIINSGIYVLKTNCIKFLKPNNHLNMNELIMKLIKKNKKVIAFPFYETWHDLGTKEQLKISKNYV